MKGIYVGGKYSLLLGMIYVLNLKEEYILFIDESLKSQLELENINFFYLENIKKGFMNKYKKWKYNKKLLNYLKNIDSLYLQDHNTYSQFFLNNFKGKMYLLEDGTLNYNEKILLNELKRKIKKIRINNFFRRVVIEKRKDEYRRFGLSNKIEKIYLTGLLPIPELIKDKVEIIKINEMWKRLSQKDKESILSIFSLDLNKIQRFNLIDNKVLLLTQPLSEDNIITEEEKIKIYREIIKKQNNKNIYIKIHPREKTNYKEIFKEFNIRIIEKNFPIELLLFLNINFDKVITLFSTGALNFKGKAEVEFIGTEKYPKLYERFGKIEMK